MAKQIGAIRFTGKVANIVGFRTSKGESMRGTVANVKNPRSAGQNVQRAIFATAGIAMAQLTEICNNSVEGKRFGNECLSYLRKKWLADIRADIAERNGVNTVLNPKGEGNFMPNSYLLSKGHLNNVAMRGFEVNADPILDTRIASEDLVNATFSQVFPDVKLGNQLTFVTVHLLTGIPGQPERVAVNYARVAAASNDVPIFVSTTADHFAFNSGALNIKLCEGAWQNISFYGTSDETEEAMHITPALAGVNANASLLAFAIIVSDKVKNRRSTTYLQLAGNLHRVLSPNWEEAAATYGNASTEIIAPSDAYLNNSDNSVTENTAQGVSVIVIDNETMDPVEKNAAGLYPVRSGKSYTMTVDENYDIAGKAITTSNNHITATRVSEKGNDLLLEADPSAGIATKTDVSVAQIGSWGFIFV